MNNRCLVAANSRLTGHSRPDIIPGMPWEKQYDQAEVLERAMVAFWERGYEATSVADLVEATGINRGSLYNDFTDKRTLFIDALKHYDKVHRANFLREVRAQHGPREAILAAFRQVIVCAGNGNDRKGCLLVNTALEMSPQDPDIEKLVQASLKEVEIFFRTTFQAGQENGSIKSPASPIDAGKHLFTLFLGLRVITRNYPQRSLMNSALRQTEALLDG